MTKMKELLGFIVALLYLKPAVGLLSPAFTIKKSTFLREFSVAGRMHTTLLRDSGREYDGPNGFVQSEYIPVDNTYISSDLDAQRLQPWYKDVKSVTNILVPAIVPIVAYLTYDMIAAVFDVLEALTSRNWVAVDGGAYQARIIAPVINGVVIPAIAVLFATLSSTTITTLRQRQVTVRTAINMEAGELRALECFLDAIPDGLLQSRCRDYLIQYTSRLIVESHPRQGSGEDVVNPRRGMDSELNGFIRVINQGYGKDIPSHIGDECYACVTRLRDQRQTRITALQSTYPPLHYFILMILAMSECVGFLIEANQDVLVFLNAVQLRVLWSMLVGTFAACFTVFDEMNSPFAGSYQISASVDQLHTIRLTLQASSSLSSSASSSSSPSSWKKTAPSLRKIIL